MLLEVGESQSTWREPLRHRESVRKQGPLCHPQSEQTETNGSAGCLSHLNPFSILYLVGGNDDTWTESEEVPEDDGVR